MVLLTLRKVLGPSTQPHGNGRFQECLHIPQSGARCWGWITTHHLQSRNPSRLPWPISPPEGHSTIVTVPTILHGLSGTAKGPATCESGLGVRSNSLEEKCSQEEGTCRSTVPTAFTSGIPVAEVRRHLWG